MRATSIQWGLLATALAACADPAEEIHPRASACCAAELQAFTDAINSPVQPSATALATASARLEATGAEGAAAIGVEYERLSLAARPSRAALLWALAATRHPSAVRLLEGYLQAPLPAAKPAGPVEEATERELEVQVRMTAIDALTALAGQQVEGAERGLVLGLSRADPDLQRLILERLMEINPRWVIALLLARDARLQANAVSVLYGTRTLEVSP